MEGGSRTVNDNNRITELCAELVPYYVLIKVDYLLEHYNTIILQTEMERGTVEILADPPRIRGFDGKCQSVSPKVEL